MKGGYHVVTRRPKPLRVRLNHPSVADNYIEFFQQRDGTFERVDHHGDSVQWYHFVKPEDMANTIYLCSCMGYKINGGEQFVNGKQ